MDFRGLFDVDLAACFPYVSSGALRLDKGWKVAMIVAVCVNDE